eukprot:scaffold831_cov268-Pinguiococcus_pyrenoidosus.AAC.15
MGSERILPRAPKPICRHNEGYMEDFYAALKEMEHGSSGAKADYDDFGRRVRSDSGLEAKKRSDSSTRNSTLAGSTVGSARRTSSNCLQRSGAGRSQVDFLAWDPALDGGLPGNLPEVADVCLLLLCRASSLLSSPFCRSNFKEDPLMSMASSWI